MVFVIGHEEEIVVGDRQERTNVGRKSQYIFLSLTSFLKILDQPCSSTRTSDLRHQRDSYPISPHRVAVQ